MAGIPSRKTANGAAERKKNHASAAPEAASTKPSRTKLPELPAGQRQQEIYLSISQIAAIDGRTRETISRRLDTAGVQPAAKRGGWPVYRLQDVWHVMVRGGTAGGGVNPDQLDPHSRRAHYQAEQVKRALDVEARRLLRAEDVEEEVARRDKLTAMAVETIVDVLERDCGLAPEQLEVVESRLDQIRTMWADWVQLPDDPTPSHDHQVQVSGATATTDQGVGPHA